jgi:methionyl-tRNA formyltransferase
MKMEKGMDTGAVIHHAEIVIGEKNRQQLTQSLSNMAPQAMLDGLEKICLGTLPQEQDNNQVTHAAKILAPDYKIDWHNEATFIAQQVRAFFPRTYCVLGEKRIRLLDVKVIKQTGEIGQITKCAEGLVVFCEKDALLIQTLQAEGKAASLWKDFYNGHQHILGQYFS